MLQRLSLRTAVAASAVAALVFVPSSEASRYVCPMVSDQARDVTVSADPTVERDMPELDIRSADLVSDDRSLTAVIRVTRLAIVRENAPLGARWGVSFKVNGTTQAYRLWALADAMGQVTFAATYVHPTTNTGMELPAGVTGVFDTERSEVRITAPLDIYESVVPLRRGVWLDAVMATTGRELHRGVAYTPADSTRHGAHRIAGRSCLKRR